MKFLAPLLALAGTAAAHGAVASYVIAGKTYPGYDAYNKASSPPTIQRQWPSFEPILQASSPKMRCNGGTSAKLSAPVSPGENVTAVWKQWTHQQGPVMVWLFKCAGEFSSCTGDGKGWFKIDQMGLIAPPLNGNNWGTGIVYKKHEWTTRVPKTITPGNYLVRHELLALHQANTPQFYPECAQIVIGGSGNKLPPADFMKSIPGYAPQSDPGITVPIDSTAATTYTCPGGAVWDGW